MQYDIVYNDKSDLKNVINDENNFLKITINNKKNIEEAVNELLVLNKIKISFVASQLYLGNIPESLFDITNIEILNLCVNLINYIPNHINKLKNLKELYLDINYFSTFPENICLLKNLERLSMSSCKIKEIPISIEKLINLDYLNLNNNPLSFLNNIYKLKNLKFLNLANCDIENLSSEIKNLYKLQFLYIYNNKFKKFPTVLCDISSLHLYYFKTLYYIINEPDNNLLIKKRLLYRLFCILNKNFLNKFLNYKIVKNLISY